MGTPTEDKQNAESWLRKGYRAAARQLHAGVYSDTHAHVQACETGAFVEVHVWVPKDEGIAQADRLLREAEAEAAEAEEIRRKQQLVNDGGMVK